MSETSQTGDDILEVVKRRYDALKKDVQEAQTTLAEAELRLESFRTNTMAMLEVASARKSGQAMRAERQAKVAQLRSDGLTRAEIVRRTGLDDHLVCYDIDCISRRKLKGSGERSAVAKEIPSEPKILPDENDEEESENADVCYNLFWSRQSDPPPIRCHFGCHRRWGNKVWVSTG
jgi:hypothetical protein